MRSESGERGREEGQEEKLCGEACKWEGDVEMKRREREKGVVGRKRVDMGVLNGWVERKTRSGFEVRNLCEVLSL